MRKCKSYGFIGVSTTCFTNHKYLEKIKINDTISRHDFVGQIIEMGKSKAVAYRIVKKLIDDEAMVFDKKLLRRMK